MEVNIFIDARVKLEDSYFSSLYYSLDGHGLSSRFEPPSNLRRVLPLILDLASQLAN